MTLNHPFSKHPFIWWLGQILLVVSLWLSLIKLPGPPLVSLDASWQMVIGYGASQGLQHGVDIVFTYGPLGYLLTSTYMGAHFSYYLCWQIIGNFLIALALYRFGRELFGWRRALYYGYLFLYGSIYADAMQMNFIAIFSLLLMRSAYRTKTWLCAVGMAYAIFSLMKFTNLLLCLFSLALLLGYYLLIRARREAVWLAGSFCLAFVGFWLLHHQHLTALPDFFYHGLQVSLGYVEAMAVYETPLMRALGVTALISIIAYAGLYIIGQRDRVAALVTALLLGAVIFMNWKHGFVRADGHVIAHFVMCLLVVCAYPALTDDRGTFRNGKGVFLTLAGLCSLTGIGLVSLPAVTQAPGGWNERLHQTVSALLDPSAYQRSLDAKLQQLATQVDQPNLRNFIGQATVDHLGGDQAYTLLNRFNYTPRPAIQGYTAYTEVLNRLDESFYRSERGPAFVIQRFRSIDERFPTLDDSLTLRLLLQNYDYVMEEGGLLLWERPEKLNLPDPSTEQVLLSRTLKFGEKLALPDTGSQPIWAVIKVQPNLMGSLRKFFYKAPLVYITTTDQDGSSHRFQLIRAIAATGFILNPFFQTGDDLINFQRGQFQRRITEFSIETMPGGAEFFDASVEVELRTLAPFKQAQVQANQKLNNRFRMMNRRPVAIESAVPLSSLLLEGKEVLMLHAESRMDFNLTGSEQTVQGSFGILPGASQNGNDTDGVEFVIECISSTGESRELFRRFLDPLRQQDDRGTQHFTITVPSSPEGKLVFRTLPGPHHSQSFDWSYWTDLKFH